MVYRDPVYHQIIFASIVLAVAARTIYLLQWTDRGVAIPPKARSTITSFFSTGLGVFALGFFVWNVDNIYCRGLTDWKMTLGWPTAFFLEGVCLSVVRSCCETNFFFRS
jgi:dihydroceramidase